MNRGEGEMNEEEVRDVRMVEMGVTYSYKSS